MSFGDPECRHFLRNPIWGPSDFGCKKSGDGHGLRRPTFVLHPSRRALRSSLTLPRFPVLLQRVLYACEVAQFADVLEAHGACAENISAVCMDSRQATRLACMSIGPGRRSP